MKYLKKSQAIKNVNETVPNMKYEIRSSNSFVDVMSSNDDMRALQKNYFQGCET